jgi:hypothetical protein
MNDTSGCPPGELSSETEEEIQWIIEFWNQLSICDELGATTRRELESIERQVTECLDKRHRDIATAASLTALAMLILDSQSR